ncbi:MAG: M15 family metallopeptidase [Agathobacter sp.]|nr:M15 family metallopeptidase [Agathobacter sp.]
MLSSYAPYVDRSLNFPHKIDHNDLCYKLFKVHGFTWGGDWANSKDNQIRKQKQMDQIKLERVSEESANIRL